ncbi:phosphatase PAP2 family protein [Belliella baltica]|nr:phosphatase PAP2 family protein [Belliella baltica]
MTKLQIAKLISIIGHPLLVGSLYVIFISFYDLEKNTAVIISIAILSVVTFPILIHNYIKTKRGTYSNFDVSDQKQRRGFYPFSILLFTICLILFVILHFPKVVLVTTASFLGMLISMALVNFKIKASLHLAIALFIVPKFFEISMILGLGFLLFGICIGWSRLTLGRHSMQEISLGSIIGFLFGLLSLYY